MYLDTANIEEIKEALCTGLITGVTTNPSILKKGEKNREGQIADIVSLGIDDIFVQVVGLDSEEMYSDFLCLNSLGKKLGVKLGIKVPLTFEGLKAIKKIKDFDKSTRVLGTAIYTADQGILGALAGCDMLAPYVNRMENNSVNPFDEIEKMRLVIDDRDLDTTILAASFKNASQVVNVLVSGSHDATIPMDILKSMVNKDVAIKAVEVFNQHGLEKM